MKGPLTDYYVQRGMWSIVEVDRICVQQIRLSNSLYDLLVSAESKLS